jgi:hypothetical protein
MDKHICITSEHILAFRHLNQRLGDFVKDAFRDEINFLHVNADLTLGQVAERTLYDLDNLARFPSRTAKRNKGDNAGNQDLDVLAYERYVEFVAKHSVSAVARQPPAQVGPINQDRIDAILEKQGLKYPKLALLEDEADMVVRAWNMARVNRQRALQRVGAFFFLASQMPSGIYGDQHKRLDNEGTSVVQFLFSRASDFQASELKFAVLLGGEALALTKAGILQDSFGPDMGVIQYLYPSERHPGHYSVSEGAAFTQKIKEYGAIGR